MAKKGFLLGILAMALTFGLALTGCPIEEYDDGANAAVPDGFGTVRVSLTQGAARTAMPTPVLADFARVEYWFAQGDAAAVQKTAIDDVFTLEAGNYTLTVKAYFADADESPAAEGASSSFTVAFGTPANVTVTMRPIVSEGNGSLSFSISYPADATVETFTLTQLAGDNPITLTGTSTTDSGTTTRTGSNVTVASGYYSLQITLIKADLTSAGAREVVHIYQNLSTEFSYAFTDAEFRMPVAITSVTALTAYLATLPDGSAAIPTTTVPLSLAFNTTNDTVPSGQIGWGAINTAVHNSGKYVILDLSASTAANGTTANTIAGSYSSRPSGNNFNVQNQYIKGIILPDTLDSIGDYAFIFCSNLTSVTIPGSVTSIGSSAFEQCYGLTSVAIIPDSVTSIGVAAFRMCSGLTSVTIGEGVISIGGVAFNVCPLTGPLTIPGSVTSIGSGAFSGCGVTAFTVAESNIDYSAQDGILYNYAKTTLISAPGAISGVTIPGSVTSIEYSAFWGCSSTLTAFTVAESNTAYSAQDGILYNYAKTTLIQVPGAISGELNNLPNTLTGIASYASIVCSNLTSVTIPGSVTWIGTQVFSGYGLTSVIFGAGSNITTLTSSGFPYSTSLWTAYTAGSKAGTYTRDGDTWTQMGGEGSVTLTFWVNEDDQILASNSSVTISKTSAGYASSFTASVSGGYGTVSWSVSGVPHSDNESIEIAAADYPTGTYRLGISVSKDGVPYSTEITFTVID